MKINFKKVATVLGSALMLGSTAAFAAAASFTPSSFTDGGVALVVGQNAASSDLKAAIDLTANLAPATSTVATTTASVSGGDSVQIKKSSDLFNLGNDASTVLVSAIDSDDMPNLLADGTYTDDDNTEYEYTQKINLGSNLDLTHFSDSDYQDKTPTVGIQLADDAHVLNYTLDFTKNPLYNASTMETTTLTLMGKDYYVLDVQSGSTNKTTLLDSATSTVITEGETTTVGAYEVSISFIGSTSVKLVVNGETTNSLSNGGTYKLSDGTYVGIKEILYSAKDTGVSKVEISIGKGKLEITDGNSIELNDDTINEIVGFLQMDSSSQLDKVVLQWTTDDEAFVAPESELIMPGFESVKISMAGFYAPKSDVVTVENDGSDVIVLSVPIEDGTADIDLLSANSTGEFSLIGKDSSNRLKTVNTTSMTFNETAGDKYIVASWNSSTEAESYYLKIDMIEEDNINKVRFTNVLDSDDVKKVANGSDASFGSVVLTVNNVTKDGSKKWADLSINSGGSFHEIYTKEGLKIYLPFLANTSAVANYPGAVNFTENGQVAVAGHSSDSFYLFMAEEDKDDGLAKGTRFNVTLNDNSDGKLQVSDVDSGAGEYEIADSDDYETYVVSDLATKLLYMTGGDQDTVEITYAGEESYADAYITAPEATVTAGETPVTTTGVMTVYDNEVSSASGKNLIVIGGSCVNTVAAELLGGALCGDAFTAATGIQSGEALIESFAREGKTALLVAGFNAEDTTKAITYLSNNNVNVAVGSKMKVTSATTATAITA